MSEDKIKEGVKFDDEKRRYDLVPADSLRQLVDIYTFGAKKYEDNNWRKGLKWGRIYGAIQRHLNAFWEGEEVDSESGLTHLAHAAWGCFTLLNYCDTKRELDDRVPTKNKLIKKEKILVYLAGSIYETKYRSNFKLAVKNLNLSDNIIIRDPLSEVDQKSGTTFIVENDKKLIKQCDIVVAYVEKSTPGTMMEIIYAYENNIPVYLITTKNKIRSSHWIKYHSIVMFKNIIQAIKEIEKKWII